MSDERKGPQCQGLIGDIRLEIDGWEPPHKLKLTMTAEVLSKIDDATWSKLYEQRNDFTRMMADTFAKVVEDMVTRATSENEVEDFEI